MGAALLIHNRSSASISDCIFFHNILEMKPNKAYEALDGRLIESTTTEKLLLGRPKGDHNCLIEVV